MKNIRRSSQCLVGWWHSTRGASGWSVSHGGNPREALRQGALVIGSPFSARMLAMLKAGSLREMDTRSFFLPCVSQFGTLGLALSISNTMANDVPSSMPCESVLGPSLLASPRKIRGSCLGGPESRVAKPTGGRYLLLDYHGARWLSGFLVTFPADRGLRAHATMALWWLFVAFHRCYGIHCGLLSLLGPRGESRHIMLLGQEALS